MDGQRLEIVTQDGIRIVGHIWQSGEGPCMHGSVIINCATGVAARYYHRYARFLANRGFTILTWDYHGIGLSRSGSLKGCDCLWRDWGQKDFDAIVRIMRKRTPSGPLAVIGHSFGGFIPGLAKNAPLVDRMLTVGAQYAWWGDYAPGRRLRLLLKWHVAMPLLTWFFGYFPGSKLGWLEDLPAGVANEWSFRKKRFEHNLPEGERAKILDCMTTLHAPVLAIAVSDDDIGTVSALRRTLSYYTGAARILVQLRPEDYGRQHIGHFKLFHDTHSADFWLDTLIWLKEGRNPWPTAVVPLQTARKPTPPHNQNASKEAEDRAGSASSG